MIDLGLGDSWRLTNPNSREYSYFSAVHKSYSRIDYFLTSNSLISDILNTTIHPIIISDHAPITITTDNRNDTKKSLRWRMNTSLLQDNEFNEYFKKEWAFFMETNDTPDISASTLWETAKVVLRGKIISYSTYKYKKEQSREKELENKIHSLHNIYSHTPNEQILKEINKTKDEHKDIIHKKIEFQKQCLRHTHFEHNDKSGKYLANLLKRNKEKTLIPVINSPEGKTLHTLQDINDTFRTFYKHLYSNTKEPKINDTKSFLNNIFLPTLTTAQRESLEESISATEYKQALESLSNNKAPGLDGYPPEYYKHFCSTISPLFLRMTAEIKNTSFIPPHMNTALISVLFKPNKDPTLCSSYHPLSLLNTDLKIISKALATRLESVISFLIHPDQTGFIKGRQSSNNTR